MLFLFLYRKNRAKYLLLKQKEDIGKDLHDEIGSGLSTILLISGLLTEKKTVPESDKKLLQKISTTSNNLADNMHLIIWSLNTQNDTLINVLDYTKKYVTNYFEDTAIVITINDAIETNHAAIINGFVRKNILLTIKEICNNILKHAKAANVHLYFGIENNQLAIAIEDDGVGLVNNNKFGNGLTNMQQRIAGINGHIEITSAKGTKISLAIPL